MSIKKYFSFTQEFPMFYMKDYMKNVVLAAVLIILASCVKTDPFPELRDEIYADLQTELSIVTKGLDAQTKSLEGLLIEITKAVPQTGQIKYATQKVRQAEDLVSALKQQKLYFEIKLETRRALVASRYSESKKDGGRAWPDKEELELYKTVMKLNRDKSIWTKTKGIKKNVPRGTTAGADGLR